MLRQVASLLVVYLASIHGQDGLQMPPTDQPASPPGPTELPLASVQAQLDELIQLQGASALEPPTVVLAGHKNDGKSALLEALLGLRLSHVGASTSTRRPLRVHSQHDPSCEEPSLFLQRDGADGAEERVSLAELRAHVEAENNRLQRTGEVEDAEIRVRLRWRLAPNVVLIDTPGLLSLPAGSAVADPTLAKTSAAAQRVLLAQLTSHPSRFCLCLEDTSDWQLSPTRDVVTRADPDLARTLLVATKLDGKLRQFSMAEDLHRLLNPTTLRVSHPKLLGGPIFTSVPPVRDASRERNPAALGESVAKEEASMRKLLLERLGSDEYAGRIGIHALRSELQPLIDRRWVELGNAAAQACDARLGSLQRKLQAPPEAESEDLEDFVHRFCLSVRALIEGTCMLNGAEHGETLQQEQANSGSGPLCPVRRPPAADRKAVAEADSTRAAGGMARPAGGTGERSNDGRTRLEFSPLGGAKGGGGGMSASAAALAAATASAAEGEEPSKLEEARLWLHAGERLYGGAQYWRAMHEFVMGAAQGLEDEEVSVEEIVNAMGVDGYHDGANYMRAVCVIVVERARGYFDDILHKLRKRMLHVMTRHCALADEMMLLEAERAMRSAAFSARGEEDGSEGVGATAASLGSARVSARPASRLSDLGGVDDVRPASPAEHALYMSAVAPSFRKFVTRAMSSTMERCVHDVVAMTRYVSWDSASPNKESLHNLVVTPVHEKLEARLAAAAEARDEAAKRRGSRGRGRGGGKRARDGADDADDDGAADEASADAARTIATYDEMVESFTETLMTRRVSEPMRKLINELVVDVIRAWREEFCRAISVKMYSGFLTPFNRDLPNFMRREVSRYAREMGLQQAGGGTGGDGSGEGSALAGRSNGDGGLDARTRKLRADIDKSSRERETLQRIALRMQATPKVVKGG